jgi:CelD/BcsL family acetyltransferase involved in cellulose biosynthesis
MEAALKKSAVPGGFRLTLYRDLASARAVWERIEIASPTYPFQRFAWLEAWQDTIGASSGAEPAVASVARPGEGAAAILPLVARRRGPLRVLEWMGWGAADYSGPIVVPGSGLGPEILIAAAREAARESDCTVIELDRNPALIAGSPNPLLDNKFRELHYRSHYMDLPEDMDGFLKARFGPKGRYNLRRAEKLLGGLGRLEYVVARDADLRAQIVDAMIRHKRDRCRATGARDNFLDPGYEAFYRTAAARAGSAVHVSALCLDGRPIAEHWGALEGGCLYYLMPAFEAGELERYSTGSLLILSLAERCREEGARRIDFTVGDEEYKARWCTGEMAMYAFEEGRGPLGSAAAAARRARRAVMRGPLLGAARAVKKAVGSRRRAR